MKTNKVTLRLVLSVILLISTADAFSDSESNIKQLFNQVNLLEEQSPGLFKDSLKKDQVKILSYKLENVPVYPLHSYISKLNHNIKGSYKAGNLDAGNKKHELLQKLFIHFENQLEVGGWLDNTLINMAQANFLRWVYTGEIKYKETAIKYFYSAEKINFKKAKIKPSSSSGYIARDTAVINANKKNPFTPKQLKNAESLSYSAYQYIAMYEDSLKIKAKLNASQEELSALAREGLNVYHAANQRIQPNTLDRAYWGVLMAIESNLNESYFSEFKKEYDTVYSAINHQRRVISSANPYFKLKALVEAGKLNEAIKVLDEYESFTLNRFNDKAAVSNIDMARYERRCPKLNHPIFDKLTKYYPERMNAYNRNICNEFKKALEAQGKWVN